MKILEDVNMSKVDVVEILQKSDALLEGHFLLSSGKHSNRYVQCAKVLRFPQYAEQVLSTVVEQIKDLDIDMGDVEISNTRDIGFIINEENGYLTFKIANYNSQTSNNNQIAQIVDYSGIFKPMMIDFIKQFVR